MDEQCSPDDFTIGWICALPHELAASQAVLDEIFHGLHLQHSSDDNVYTFGRIGHHRIVMVALPGRYGIASASTVANNLKRSFPSIRLGLMVGVGGGVWSDSHDVRLGDVCVSFPGATHGGVVQYDAGKALPGGGFLRKGTLNKPPGKLLSAVENLKAVHERLPSALPLHLASMFDRNPAMVGAFSRPSSPDNLFKDDVLVAREPRATDAPSVHYGLIASGNSVIASEQERDRLCALDDIICFEMEAAGLMDSFPSLIIRGICDYCDSHKSDVWQKYAAAVAAAYATELLTVMSAPEPLVAPPKPSRASTLATFDLSEPSNYRLSLSLRGLRPVTDFVGRIAEMAGMERSLLFDDASSNAPQRRKIFILYGVGGMGKTSLSLHFAQKHQGAFDSILWINASSADSVKESFQDLSRRLVSAGVSNFPKPIPLDSSGAVLSWLAIASNRRWLLVFDNVDRAFDAADPDPQAFIIDDYLPEADHGSIIITSRLQNLKALGDSVELKGLNQEDSKRLLESQVHRSLEDDRDASATVERLGGLPLALTLAGSLVQERRGTFKSYNEQYQNQWHKLISSQDVHGRSHGHRQAVMTTWTVSYEQVKIQRPRAIQLLELWSFLNHARLQHSLFHPIARTMRRFHSWPAWLVDLSANEIDFFDEISHLIRYSLISQVVDDESETYAIHPVIHEWCFQMLRLADGPHTNLLCETAAAVIAYQVPLDEEREGYWNNMRVLLPHGNRAFLRIQECYGKSASTGANDDLSPDIAARLGRLIYKVGELKDAENLLLRATKGFEASHRLRDENMVDTLNLLGRIFTRLEKFDQAGQVFIQTLQRVESTFGRDHVEALHLVNNLGVVYEEQGRINEAKAMYERVLSVSNDGPLRMNTLSNMGHLWARLGNPGLAIHYYREALNCERPWQDTLAATQTTLNLGNTYYKLGRYKAACMMLEKALAGYEKLLGKDAKSTLGASRDLGSAYIRLGKISKADECFTRALDGYEKFPGHPAVSRLLRGVGRTREARGLLEDAAEMYRRLVDENEKTLGPYDIETLDASKALGRVLSKNQAKKIGLVMSDIETKNLLERACERYEETLGPFHRKTRQMEHILDKLYGAKGQSDRTNDWWSILGSGSRRTRFHMSPRTSNNSSSLMSDQGRAETSPTRPLSRDGSSGRSSGRSSSRASLMSLRDSGTGVVEPSKDPLKNMKFQVGHFEPDEAYPTAGLERWPSSEYDPPESSGLALANALMRFRQRRRQQSRSLTDWESSIIDSLEEEPARPPADGKCPYLLPPSLPMAKTDTDARIQLECARLSTLSSGGAEGQLRGIITGPTPSLGARISVLFGWRSAA